MDAAVHETKAPTCEAPKTAGSRLALLSACLGWMFDAFDLQLFTVILFPCIGSLIGSANPADVAYHAGIVSSAKLLAWGLGGIAFGVVADRIGRSRTMMVTVLILYEASRVNNFLSFFRFKREGFTRMQFCLDGMGDSPCLAALSGQPPQSPQGRAARREGLDGESACRATMMSGHYAATVRSC